jgi:hypothetical protein
MVALVQKWGGVILSLRWVSVIVCAGTLYFAFGQTLHADLITAPDDTIIRIGRSIGQAVGTAASALKEALWS